jgi:hypothetical protein
MCLEDSILDGKILALQQQLLIDEATDVRQELSPVMTVHPDPIFSNRQFCTRYQYFDLTGWWLW